MTKRIIILALCALLLVCPAVAATAVGDANEGTFAEPTTAAEQTTRTDPRIQGKAYYLLPQTVLRVRSGDRIYDLQEKILFADADGNGRCNAADARILLRIASLLDAPPADISGIDVDENGRVQTADARRVLRAAARLDKYACLPNGGVLSGFLQTEAGDTVYVDACGAVAVGYQRIQGKGYFFAYKTYAMQTGQLTVQGRPALFDAQGAGVSGQRTIGDKQYLFADGLAQTGWQTLNGKQYYFTADGCMAAGQAVTINGQTLYFDAAGQLKDGVFIENDKVSIYRNGVLKPINASSVNYDILSDSNITLLQEPTTIKINEELWYLTLVNNQYRMPADYVVRTAPAIPGSDYELDSRVAVWYTAMYNAAAKDGVYLTPYSGYRSYARQKINYENKTNLYLNQGYTLAQSKAKAAMVIMPPGCSEHNLGLAMDIIATNDNFYTTRAYRWLCEHAADYGFILRYPKDKQHITKVEYEPWHWRYVGVGYARAIKLSGLCLEEFLSAAELTPVPLS